MKCHTYCQFMFVCFIRYSTKWAVSYPIRLPKGYYSYGRFTKRLPHLNMYPISLQLPPPEKNAIFLTRNRLSRRKHSQTWAPSLIHRHSFTEVNQWHDSSWQREIEPARGEEVIRESGLSTQGSENKRGKWYLARLTWSPLDNYGNYTWQYYLVYSFEQGAAQSADWYLVNVTVNLQARLCVTMATISLNETIHVIQTFPE